MADLTDLIRHDAEAKCTKAVDKFCEELRNKPFFKPLHNLEVNLPDGSKCTLGAGLYNTSYDLGKMIKNFYLQAYISEESQQFYDKVKKMKSKTEEE